MRVRQGADVKILAGMTSRLGSCSLKLDYFIFFFFFKTPTAPGLPKESPIPKQARPRLASEIRRDRMRSGWRGR